VFGAVDWDALEKRGMEPGAGFLIDRVYASIKPSPAENTPECRKDYAVGIENLRARLEKCDTANQVLAALKEIREERDGVSLTEEQSAEYSKMTAEINRERKMAEEKKAVLEELKDKANQANRLVNQLVHEKYKQTRQFKKRGVAPELLAELEKKKAESESAEKAYRDYKEKHPELERQWIDVPGGSTRLPAEVDKKWLLLNEKRSEFLAAVKEKNAQENSVTRAWTSLGDKFDTVLKRRGGAFASHAGSVLAGRVKDWSWAKKEKTHTATTFKKDEAFYLRVSSNFDRKGGRDVSAHSESTGAMKEAFNLRDIQSGNWVLKDRGSAAFHVQRAVEGFADLADILGVDDKDISMNGRLAMAFGARGQGGKNAAMAHYEPVERVINITKIKGGGALAHEWFHAMDNLVGAAMGGEGGEGGFKFYATEGGALNRPELQQAFADLTKAMRSGNAPSWEQISINREDTSRALRYITEDTIKDTSGRGDYLRAIYHAKDATEAVNAIDGLISGTPGERPDFRRRSNINNWNSWRRLAVAFHVAKGSAQYAVRGKKTVAFTKTGAKTSEFLSEASKLDVTKTKAYWATTREMGARAFQSYIEDKLREKGRQNDYLSAMADNKFYEADGAKPFPEGEERKKINAAFDALMAEMRNANAFQKAEQYLGRTMLGKVFIPHNSHLMGVSAQ
jgi:hypothetical protein